jgi:CHAD domain-containing protein
VTSRTPKSVSLEREVKLRADLNFVLPDLRTAVGWSADQPEQHLRTAYFDTMDFRLWQRGITFRRRAGEEAGDGTWTLKLPAHSEGPTLDRIESSRGGHLQSPPAEATRLLQGIARRSSFHQIVGLDATRRRIILHDADGVACGELDDDTVTVIGGSRDGIRFRQIEFELGPGGDVFIGPLLKLLTSAGARLGGEQKLAEALDLPARMAERPEFHVQKTSSMGDLVIVSILAALDRLLDNDWRIRVDPTNPSVESVHQARVATRRLRSHLKLFKLVLDPVWVARARADLKWLGEVLGRVRDADVLAVLFDGDGDGSAFDAEGRDELRSNLNGQRRTHCRELAGALADRRYLNLLDLLEAAADRAPFDESWQGKGLSARSLPFDRPARKVLPRLVGQRWRALRREVRRAGPHPSDRALHSMRIRAKELRYAAESATPVIGEPARRTAMAAETVQNVLGDHHDAVSAELWFRTQARSGTLAASYSAGRLAAEETRSQMELRRRWQSVWRQLDQRKLRQWF